MQVRSVAIGSPHEAGLENGARLVSVVAGVLLGATALLHLSAAGDHTNLPVMMAGFLVMATLQAALGALVALRRVGRLLAWAGLALTLGALGTWLLSRTTGLPFLPGGHMEPIGFKDGVTVLLEVATLPFLALLPNRDLDRMTLPSRRLSTHALGLLGSGIFALFLPAFVLGGGEHHSASQMAAGHHGDGGGDHGHGGSQRASTGSGSHGGHAHAGGDERGHGGEGHHEQGKRSAGGHDDHGSPGGGATQLASAGGGTGHGDHGDSDGSPGGGSSPGSESGGHGGHDGGGHAHGRDDRDGGGEKKGKGHGHGGRKDDGTHHGAGAGPHGGDADHGAGGHGGDGGGDHGDGPPGDGQRSVALESGGPGRGPALMLYDRPDERTNGAGHASHGGGPCSPSPQQRAAADELFRQTAAELRKYENNPGRALADGFDYAFGPTDRMLHMVHLRRLRDPDVLKAPEIESFIYYMTDSGFVPIAGMYVMPRYGDKGPQPGGCLTKWHHHGGVIGRWATLGTSDNTPDMMHVFTYPGLDPWGHYDGRELSQLWTPGGWVPSVCRRSGDANDGCLP